MAEDNKTYRSNNKTLSFNERMGHAVSERKVIQGEYEAKKRLEAEEILNTVDAFIDRICNKEELTQKFVESIHRTNSRRKYVELFSFNNLSEVGEVYNDTIQSVDSEEKKFSTRYILSEKYDKLTKKYFPERSTSLVERITTVLNTEEFNNGVDIETGEKLIPCVFIYKKEGSKFKNGVIVSRDGIDYGNFRYNKDDNDKDKDNKDNKEIPFKDRPRRGGKGGGGRGKGKGKGEGRGGKGTT
uniref:Uncharacterized protein n=1 Tax=viral metagenome TaxID=1070528 RepID=A0A6C0LJ27_9ZZZZ